MRVPWLQHGEWTSSFPPESPGEAGVENPGRWVEQGRVWGREEGAGGKSNWEAEQKGRGADRLDLRETFRARPRALA